MKSPALNHIPSSTSWKLSPQTLTLAITSIFLISTVLDGPIRYYLNQQSASLLTYIPKMLMLLAIILCAARNLSIGATLGIALILGVFLPWGMINLSNVHQAFFGAWVVIPFLYGLICDHRVLAPYGSYKYIFAITFITSTTGVLISPFCQFPWVGYEMFINGKAIEVSRQWTTLGIDRYAGFARASFNAASQVLTISLLFVLSIRSLTLSTIVWLTGGIAITLTTAKGPIAAWLALTLLLLTARVSNRSKIWRLAWSTTLWAALAAAILLPVSTFFYQYNPDIQSTADKLLLASIGERVTWMWPQSFALLENPMEWVLGRGLGGIGTAQLQFESTAYLPADNIFVYLAVLAGPVTAVFILMGLTYKTSAAFYLDRISLAVFATVLALLLYGVVANIIEEPIMAFLLGAAFSALGQTRRLRSIDSQS